MRRRPSNHSLSAIGGGSASITAAEVVAFLEQPPTFKQRMKGVDVLASLKCARGRVTRDLLVFEDAEVGEDELGPVLVEVAEEQQPQPIAQRLDDDAKDDVGRVGPPLASAAAAPGARPRCHEHVSLARVARQRRQARSGLTASACRPTPAPRACVVATKHPLHLALPQHPPQLRDREDGCAVHPPRFDQCGGGSASTADLLISKLFGAKQVAPAAQHPDQEGRRLQGQPLEPLNECPPQSH